MENILNIHKALVKLILINSIYQKFLKTSLELHGWQYASYKSAIQYCTALK